MPRSRGGPLKSQVSIVVHFKIHRWVNEREKEYIGECKKKKKKTTFRNLGLCHINGGGDPRKAGGPLALLLSMLMFTYSHIYMEQKELEFLQNC